MTSLLDPEVVHAFLDDAHFGVAKLAHEFAADEIMPLDPPTDDAGARVQAREILAKLGASGLIRHVHPLDLRACCLAREALAAASPLADEVFALQCLGSTPIAIAGSDELRQRYLPRAMAGEAMAAFAMTEEQAGSDVGSLGTRAVRDGADYVIDGSKTLISNAGIADFYVVFAKTDPNAGHRGVSCFVVDANTPGLELVRPLLLSAPHPLGEIALVGCRVPASQRVGDEGGGFKLGMATLDSLRATVAAAACGMAARALDEATGYALTRKQFGVPIADFQIVQEKLAAMATELTASRLLVYRAAAEKDAGKGRVTVESAMAKAFATEAAQRIIDSAVQILGGRGVLAEHPVDRLYRAIRPLRIYEGTTEIQHLVIARALLRAKREHAG